MAEWSKAPDLESLTLVTYVRFPVMVTFFFRNLYKLFLLMVYRSIIHRIIISLYNIVLLQHFVYLMTKE